MTEQKIEQIIINELSGALAAADITNVQTIGAWQTSNDDSLKAFEDGRAHGVLAVKAYPRTYETPTIADCAIQVDISLTMRADIDKTGAEWIAATDAISRKTHLWQKSYNDYAPTFAVEGEFEPTGYNIAGGDCGLDRSSGTWQFSQSLNLYGIISFDGN